MPVISVFCQPASHQFERMRTAGVAKIATSQCQWLLQRLSSSDRRRRPTAAVCSLASGSSSSS